MPDIPPVPCAHCGEPASYIVRVDPNGLTDYPGECIWDACEGCKPGTPKNYRHTYYPNDN